MNWQRFAVRGGLGALVLLWGVVPMALAQRGQGGPGGGRGGVVSRVSLATLDSVQAALKLTDEQKTKVAAINDELRAQRRGQGGGPAGGQGSGDAEARRQARREQTAAATKKVNEVLDEAQRKRLTEVYVQATGAMAVLDEEVSKAISLTDEQRQKAEEIESAYNQELRALMQADSAGESRREKMTELRNSTNEKLLAVLTDAQRPQLDSLKGEKIDIDLSQLRGGGGGGGGRGGAAGGGGGGGAGGGN